MNNLQAKRITILSYISKGFGKTAKGRTVYPTEFKKLVATYVQDVGRTGCKGLTEDEQEFRLKLTEYGLVKPIRTGSLVWTSTVNNWAQHLRDGVFDNISIQDIAHEDPEVTLLSLKAQLDETRRDIRDCEDKLMRLKEYEKNLSTMLMEAASRLI